MDLETLSDAQRRLRRAGIASDATGAVYFEEVVDGQELAWETPRVASDLPGFVSSLLDATGEQERFILLRRGGAAWFTRTGYDQGPIVEQLRDRIIATLPIPSVFDGAPTGCGAQRHRQRAPCPLSGGMASRAGEGPRVFARAGTPRVHGASRR